MICAVKVVMEVKRLDKCEERPIRMNTLQILARLQTGLGQWPDILYGHWFLKGLPAYPGSESNLSFY
jgi:hypothetical protein